MWKTLVPAQVVYQSWFAHEQRTRGNVPDELRELFLKQELPRRAWWPLAWYRCVLEPGWALDLLVGEGWKDWTEWSRPEGLYLCIAQKIVNADPNVRPEMMETIRKLVTALDSTESPLFKDDPLILRGKLLDGPLTVIEGHHRTTAVSVAVMEGRALSSFVAYIGIGP